MSKLMVRAGASTCIATLLNRPLLLCARNEGGVPLDLRLENFETSLADILRADTVQTLEANLHFLNILDDAIKKTLCEKQTGQFYSSHSRSDSLQCFLMMNMLVNLRFVV